MVTPYEPQIVAFLCTWCSYAGADRAGASRIPLPPGLRTIRLPCSGRVEPHFIFKALAEGADGVLTLSCHPGDCHYREGNCRALQRHLLAVRVLEQLGYEKDRIRFDYVSAGEGERFASIVVEMSEKVGALGPLANFKQRTGGI